MIFRIIVVLLSPIVSYQPIIDHYSLLFTISKPIINFHLVLGYHGLASYELTILNQHLGAKALAFIAAVAAPGAAMARAGNRLRGGRNGGPLGIKTTGPWSKSFQCLGI